MRRPGSLSSAGWDAKAKASKPSMPKNNFSIFFHNLIPEICRKGREMLRGLRTENLKIRSASDAVRSAIFCIFSKFCFHQFLYLN